LRDKTLWADAGHEIAFGQKVLGEYKPVRKAARPRFQVSNCDVNIGVKTDAMSVIIDKTKGKMVSLQAGEKELVRVPIMPASGKRVRIMTGQPVRLSSCAMEDCEPLPDSDQKRRVLLWKRSRFMLVHL
jgi:beta-galactosidase/beta-glucuronidase